MLIRLKHILIGAAFFWVALAPAPVHADDGGYRPSGGGRYRAPQPGGYPQRAPYPGRPRGYYPPHDFPPHDVPPPDARPPAPSRPSAIYGWDPEEPAPEGYRRVTTINGAMLGAGIGLLTSAWVTSVIVAAAAGADAENDFGDELNHKDWAPLYAPVAGPFIAIHTVHARASGTGLLLADGIFQLAGLALIIGGAADSETHVELLQVGDLHIEPALVATEHGAVTGISGRF